MEPTFAIIMTTYKRPAEVLRALASIEGQHYQNWRALVVIDDIDSDYRELRSKIQNDHRFTLLQNEHNMGKNVSVNRALTTLRGEDFDGYIIFLDDDDWLDPACLSDFATAIKTHPADYWFVSQRTHHESKHPYTVNKTRRALIHYLRDCLIVKRFLGDATHCINFKETKTATFSHTIKNAEEWLYFATVARTVPRFRYLEKAGTYSTGYAPGGLTDEYHKHTEQKQNARKLARELWERRLFNPYLLFYISVRLLRSIIS